jgi:hypothetical protein
MSNLLPRKNPCRKGEGTGGERENSPTGGQGGPITFAAQRPPLEILCRTVPPKIEWGTGRANTDHGRSVATPFSEPISDPA